MFAPTWRHHRAKVGGWSRTASEKGTANDQGHYRYCAVFLHGRYGDWSRNRRCELPDLAPTSRSLHHWSRQPIYSEQFTHGQRVPFTRQDVIALKMLDLSLPIPGVDSVSGNDVVVSMRSTRCSMIRTLRLEWLLRCLLPL